MKRKASDFKDFPGQENPNKKLDGCKLPVAEDIPICPQDIKKVMTSAGALARPFLVGDFVPVRKKHIHIRGYVDYYGGFGNHCRETILRLSRTGSYCIKLSPIKTPIDIHPDLFNQMNWFTQNPAFKQDESTFLLIAGPGHMQKKFIPKDGRYKIAWTMIETLGVQPEIIEWSKNMDLILCPTEIDYHRFHKAGGKNLKVVPIGYDPELYHPNVEPMDITNVRDRYVFGVLGSWNHRKGVEDIVHAYCMQFTSDDPVSLLLVCKYGNRPYGPDKENTEQWGIRNELQVCLDKLHIKPHHIPHICVLDVPMHPPVIPHVCARVDCLVGFSMGESTWLPGLEMAAMEKPIIQLHNEACGYMDYLRDGRYMCKDIQYIQCDETLYESTSEYYKGQQMGTGNVRELAEMMQKVYDERNTPVQRTEINKRHKTIQHRTWDHSMEKLMEVLG